MLTFRRFMRQRGLCDRLRYKGWIRFRHRAGGHHLGTPCRSTPVTRSRTKTKTKKKTKTLYRTISDAINNRTIFSLERTFERSLQNYYQSARLHPGPPCDANYRRPYRWFWSQYRLPWDQPVRLNFHHLPTITLTFFIQVVQQTEFVCLMKIWHKFKDSKAKSII